MTVAAVLTRISEIQQQIVQMESGSADSAATDAASSSDSSTAFASALADAGATGDTSATSALTTALTDSAGASAKASGASTATPTTTTAASSTGGLVDNGVTGNQVVADAKKYLGVPYVFGGTTTAGMDCSGLVQTVFKDLGITMPRVVPDQAKMGVAVPNLASAQPGDIITTKSEGHVVIYVGDGKVLHAPHPGKDVRIVNNWLTDADIGSIRRIVPATSSVSTASTGYAASAVTAASASKAAAAAQADLYTAALQQMMANGASS